MEKLSFHSEKIILIALLLSKFLLLEALPGVQKTEPKGFFNFSFGNHCNPPPKFPSSIQIKREVFKDPLHKLPDQLLWKVTIKNPTQIVTLTNWAFENSYNLHSLDLLSHSSMSSSFWTPSLIRETNCSKTLLVDLSKSLTKVKLISENLVTVETGVKLTKLLSFLEENGLALPISPIPGQKVLKVGEAISIGAYGVGVNSFKEKSTPFATISSLVMSFKTIAWDRFTESYSLKKLDRPDPRSFAFLTNLGRSMLTEVTLLVQPKYHLRCQTFSEFSSDNLFASPNSTFSLLEESFAFLVEEFGKVEITYFPYVDRAWTKVWSRESKRPLGSLRVNQKYLSGAFSPVSNVASVLATKIVSYLPSFAPSLSRLLFDIGVFRMRLSGANDIWGASHETFFTFTNDTETYNTRGYVILTRRKEIQQVVHEFYEQFTLLRDQFRYQEKFPTFRPLKIRVTGLDSSGANTRVKLIPPALSVLAPPSNHPEFDIAVIFEMEFLPRDKSGEEFVKELEPWIYANYQGDYALIRPLWSTEWAHESGSFKGHEGSFKQLIRQSYGPAWDKAIRILNYYDPHEVFVNPFFKSLAKL